MIKVSCFGSRSTNLKGGRVTDTPNPMTSVSWYLTLSAPDGWKVNIILTGAKNQNINTTRDF